MHMSESDRLPDSIIDFIHTADTVFIGTSYHAQDKDKLFYPSHVGQNQRGGKPGFVRVKRSDGRTVILPDYSGTSHRDVELFSLLTFLFSRQPTADFFGQYRVNAVCCVYIRIIHRRTHSLSLWRRS